MDSSEPFDFGPLFAAVQRQGVFPDRKTFADCIPRRDPAQILSEYLSAQRSLTDNFELQRFVDDNFIIPKPAHVEVPAGEPVEAHIRTLWRALQHEPDRQE